MLLLYIAQIICSPAHANTVLQGAQRRGEYRNLHLVLNHRVLIGCVRGTCVPRECTKAALCPTVANIYLDILNLIRKRNSSGWFDASSLSGAHPASSLLPHQASPSCAGVHTSLPCPLFSCISAWSSGFFQHMVVDPIRLNSKPPQS